MSRACILRAVKTPSCTTEIQISPHQASTNKSSKQVPLFFYTLYIEGEGGTTAGEGEAIVRVHITDANDNHGRDDLDIWKDGCIEVLRQKMKVEVKPMLLAYVGVGVVLALVELITVVLASAYTAQISRGSRKDKFAWQRRQGGADVVRNQAETRPVLRTTETNF